MSTERHMKALIEKLLRYADGRPGPKAREVSVCLCRDVKEGDWYWAGRIGYGTRVLTLEGPTLDGLEERIDKYMPIKGREGSGETGAT